MNTAQFIVVLVVLAAGAWALAPVLTVQKRKQ